MSPSRSAREAADIHRAAKAGKTPPPHDAAGDNGTGPRRGYRCPDCGTHAVPGHACPRQYKGLDLDGPHALLLQRSGVTPAVATARGYRTVRTKTELKRLGFTDAQCHVPALLVPIHNVAGDIATYQIRPDAPRVDRRTGKVIKYETPTGSVMVLDIPPPVRSRLGKPTFPLVITEGARKADSAVSRDLCCVNLLGVWNWRGTNDHGGKTALADWEMVALNDRAVYLAFDSDVTVKREVHAALMRLKAFLESRGAIVRVVYLPPGEGGAKVGLDDWIAGQLATGKDPQAVITGLFALAEEDLRPLPNGPDDGEDQDVVAPEYVESPRGLVRVTRRTDKNGFELEPRRDLLSNFDAEITGEIVEDDGADERLLLEVTAGFSDVKAARATVAADQFHRLDWVHGLLGGKALTYPDLREHAIAAIRTLSGGPEGVIPRRRVFTHTGWREVDGRSVYLSQGGAIGDDGVVGGIEVRLPEQLRAFALPPPPSEDDLVRAVRASLRLLDVASHAITVPVYAAIWRAPLGPASFSVHVAGETGTGKSVTAALAQAHWGAEFRYNHLPLSWESTSNSLEAILFHGKDVLVVVDDLSDVQRQHAQAERVFRGQGNQSGRSRMRRDSSLQPTRSPRGLAVSTGEDVPRGRSLRARFITVKMGPRDLVWAKIERAQEDAAAGRYAEAMAAYVSWLARRTSRERAEDLRRRVSEYRTKASQSIAGHRRVPDITAHLMAGFQSFLLYAVEVGAVTRSGATTLGARAWQALGTVAAAQSPLQDAADPVTRFLELIQAALVAGRAHLTGMNGSTPWVPDPAEPADLPARMFGWRDGKPLGDAIGWADGDGLYLEPEAAFAVAQRLARDGNETLAIGTSTLGERFSDRGLLRSKNPGRHTLRKRLGGSSHHVWHLALATLQVDEPGHWDALTPDPGDEAPESEADDRF